eukprot:TRINITY_DN14777_c0_g1_i1.p1 TRINITY_DN14777_c0_g1~~TRINITY_DN14777_c0_g1_i1.p1  ORF type:complete len:114 (+),score=15.43 TRINITY_DN14777_c0_g1_i1:39-344(+)
MTSSHAPATIVGGVRHPKGKTGDKKDPKADIPPTALASGLDVSPDAVVAIQDETPEPTLVQVTPESMGTKQVASTFAPPPKNAQPHKDSRGKGNFPIQQPR